MKFDLNMDPSPEERFIDAAIREKTRLGLENQDDELVASILTKTVYRGEIADNNLSPVPPAQDRRIWFASAVAAVAVMTLVAIGLNYLPYRSGSADAPEMQFSVRLLQAEEIEEVAEESGSAPSVSALPHRGTSLPDRPTTPGVANLKSPDTFLEITTSFSPAFTSFPERPERKEWFRIVSEQERSDGHLHIYSGNVRIDHEEFLIEANSAEVRTVPGGADSNQPYLVAYDVVLTQYNPARRVTAGRMTFDPGKRSFMLSAVRQLSTPEGEMGPFNMGDRVIVSGNSLGIENFEPVGEDEPVKYANPLPLLRK